MKITSFSTRKPKSGAKPKQLVILLHGLGANKDDLIDLAQEYSDILPNAEFISPDAPFAYDMAPFGRQWFSLQTRDEDSIYNGIKNAAPILKEFIDDRLQVNGLTYNDLILMGFSQGSMMLFYLVPRLPEAPMATIAYSGMLVKADMLEKEIASCHNFLIIHGQLDDIIPYQRSINAQELLLAHNINAECHIIKNLGHGINYECIEISKNYLKNSKNI
jgi:phospholipase/carboxylesterase